MQRKPADYSEHSDHRADLTLLLECMLTVFDLKVLAPIGSDAGERGGAARQRGASFGFGIATPRAERPAVLMVHGRRERLGPPATFNIDTGATTSHRKRATISAQALGVSVVLIRVPELSGWRCLSTLVQFQR